MTTKEDVIKASFNQRNIYLDKIKKFAENAEDLNIAIILLSCYVDELATLTINEKSTRLRFIKFLQKYSNECKLIDLLYFYQWEKNHYIKNSNKYYKKLTEGKELYYLIKKFIEQNWPETEIKNSISRYKDLEYLVKLTRENLGNQIDCPEKNTIQNYLALFSNAEVFYHLGRCTLIHEGNTLLLNVECSGSQNIKFKPNHLITPSFLISLLRNALKELEDECLQNKSHLWEIKLGIKNKS